MRCGRPDDGMSDVAKTGTRDDAGVCCSGRLMGNDCSHWSVERRREMRQDMRSSCCWPTSTQSQGKITDE